jgi:hypothetical protein
MYWIEELHQRNNILAWYSWVCLIGAITCFTLSKTTSVQVNGINAYIKPTKFFLSTVIFCATMAWIAFELKKPITIKYYSIAIIAILSFELIVITWQAANGRISHFNISTKFYSLLFSLMGIAISILTLYTAYIGYLFFVTPNLQIPVGYLWGIRLGILFFVIFAFEGGIMGAKLQHTIGALDNNNGIQFLNWSKKYGDLRIAHFIGMHALQILPLAGFYVFKTPASFITFCCFYFVFTVYTLLNALRGLPLKI